MSFKDEDKKVKNCCARDQRIGQDCGLVCLIVEQIHEKENFILSKRVSRKIAYRRADWENGVNDDWIESQREDREMIASQIFKTVIQKRAIRIMFARETTHYLFFLLCCRFLSIIHNYRR